MDDGIHPPLDAAASAGEDQTDVDLARLDSTESSPAPSDEGRRVIELETAFWETASVGSVCYAIEFGWWQRWCEFAGVRVEGRKRAHVEDFKEESKRPPRPGPIDNVDLEKSTLSLTAKLKEGVDYTFKSPATWELFKKLYPASGPPVARPILMGGKTDLYLTHYLVHRSSQLSSAARDVYVPKDGTVGDLKSEACSSFGLEEVDVRLWDYYQKKKYGSTHLEEQLDQPLEKQSGPLSIIAGQDFLLEEKVNGKFPEIAENSSSFGGSQTFFGRFGGSLEDTTTEASGAIPGTAGLVNLGSTCFMNSSVQCLAHSIPLMRVFLSHAFEADVNRDNPLGNKGQLAEAFGSLMQKLWQGNVRSVNPKKFKHQIANFAPHFAGYQQHDSQELLAFLLDGLHEDLNRVRDKPYIEEPDSDGRPDAIVAAEAWQNYKARNDSFIVDHFQGMYKSTLVCPDCSFHSVKMDSFNCLSLPLPAAKMRSIQVTVVTMDGSAPPLQYAVEVLKLGVIGDLYAALAKVCGVEEADPTQVLLIVEIVYGKVHRKFTEVDERLADAICGNITLLAYKYPSPEVGPASGGKELHVFQRRARKRSTFSFSERYEVFAAPLLLWLPEEGIKAAAAGDVDPTVESLFNSPNPLTQAVETALRPFKRQRTEGSRESDTVSSQLPQLPSYNLGQEGDLTDQPMPEAASEKLDPWEELGNSSDAPQGEGPPSDKQSTGSSSETDLSSVAMAPPTQQQTASKANVSTQENTAVLGSGALSISPRETPPTSPVLSPVGTSREDSGDSTSFQASIGEPAPFDMFQAQTARGRPDHAEPENAGLDEGGAPPYRIQAAAPNGQPVSSSLSLDEGQLFFAIEWANDASSLYEPERIEQPQLHASVEEARARQAAGPRPHTLDECIEAFLEGERLEDSESWYCNRCKKLVQADKKLDLWSLPEVLVVHLKRFSYSHRFRDKIDALVKFPLTGLDLSGATLRRQEEEPVYDLFAVSNHFGGLGGGHYTAFCKLNEEGRWFCFDDSSTYEVPADRVMSPAAYVLFYRRRTEATRDAGKSVDALISDMTAKPNGVVSESLASEMPESGNPKEAVVTSPTLPKLMDPQLGECRPQSLALGSAPFGREGRCSEGGVQEAPANGLLAENNMIDWASQTHM